MTTQTLTGHEARDYAIAHDLLVSKYADPIDNGGEYHPDDAVIDEALAADPRPLAGLCRGRDVLDLHAQRHAVRDG